MTVAGRSCSKRGVSLRIRWRITSPRLKPGMNQQTLEDVRVAALMRAAHPNGVIEMREGAFDQLAR
jgi:hypothetical protein